MMSATLRRRVRDWISVVATSTTNHGGMTKVEVPCLIQISKCKMEMIWVSLISNKASVSPCKGEQSLSDRSFYEASN